jgi:hypothetical protein
VLTDDALELASGDVRHALRVGEAAALDENHHRRFVDAAPRLVLLEASGSGLCPDVRLVSFNRPRKARLKGRLLHRLPDAVRHEPGALIGHAEHPVKLMRAHALLGRAEQVEREQPLIQRDMTGLKDRPHRDSELLAASRALPKPSRLVLEEVRLALGLATVRAHRPFGQRTDSRYSAALRASWKRSSYTSSPRSFWLMKPACHLHLGLSSI